VSGLHAAEIVKVLISSMARNALGVFFCISLGSILGFSLGVLMFRYWNRLVARKGWLAVHEKADPFIRMFILSLWVLALPLLSAAAGLIMGITCACTYVITNEHIVELAGRHAFRALAAAVLVNRRMADSHINAEDERIAYAKRLMKGEESVSLELLKGITPRNLAEAGTSRLQDYLPAIENGMVHAGVLIIAERSISWMLSAATDDRADFLLKTCDALVRLDEASDRDGRVSLEEIATIISRVHLEKKVTGIIFLFGTAKTSLVLGFMVVIMVLPLLMALCVRKGIALYGRKKNRAAPKDAGAS
jgi:hypothetical protein